MILGRPTNLWLGLVSALTAFVQVAVVTVAPDINPVAVATVLGALTLLLGAIIALIANQPPAVKEGEDFVVITPTGQANETRTA